MAQIIEGYKFELFLDYDRYYSKNDLASLSYKGKVKYFEERINLILLEPLRRMINPSIRKRLEEKNKSALMLCFTSLICCGIDGLAKYYSGTSDRNKNNQIFKEFVMKYMDRDYFKRKFKGKLFVDYLRDNIRNGLAHGFCIRKDAGIEGPGTEYFKIQPYGLEINPWKLYKDFVNAKKAYIRDLRNTDSNSELAQNFIKQFNNIFIEGN